MRISRLAFLAALTLPLLSCRTATEIKVEVTTDPGFDCAALTTIIAVGTASGVETKHPATTTLSCVDGRIGALVIVPSGDDNAEVAFRVVTARGKDPDACGPGYAGCIVARRALRFLPHTSLTVSVPLRQSCFDKACVGDGDFSTCVNGQCVDATIADSTACTGSGCDESSLHPEADAGAPDATVDGTAPDGGDGGPRPPAAWVPMASSGAFGFSGRTGARGVWTGSQMIVWGGAIGGAYGSDGAAYDPVTDRWTRLPDGQLTGRDKHTMVWSGAEVIIWGGLRDQNDGARYDVTQRVWRDLEPVPTGFKGRTDHTAVWATTSEEMIVWGGHDDVPVAFGDGAAYSPAKRTWRPIKTSPLSPRTNHGAVWNGTRMIIFGGRNGATFYGDAAAYEPKSDTWSAVPTPPAALDPRDYPIALATGPSLSLATFYGGGTIGLTPAKTTGATYDAASGKWTVIDTLGPQALFDPARYNPAAWWGDGRLWIWGGYTTMGGDVAHDDGAVYDPAADVWSSMPAGGPSRRAFPVAVWTGTEAIIWSGETAAMVPDGSPPQTLLLDDGKRFRP